MVNGWPFFLTSTKTYTKLVPDISEDEAIRVLHDPPTLIHLNPLVFKSHALDPSRPLLYTIHDYLTVFKMFKMEIVYSVDFTRTSDGMDSQTKAGAGTTVKGQWRARRQDSGEIEISETVTVRAIFLFLPFIVSTMDRAHTALLERLAEKLKEVTTTDSPMDDKASSHN